VYLHSVDYEFLDSLGEGRFQYLPKFLAATRLHPEAKTIAKRVTCLKEVNDILRYNIKVAMALDVCKSLWSRSEINCHGIALICWRFER